MKIFNKRTLARNAAKTPFLAAFTEAQRIERDGGPAMDADKIVAIAKAKSATASTITNSATPIFKAVSPPIHKPAPAASATMPTAAAIAAEIVKLNTANEAAAKVKTRSQFSALNTREKSEFFKNGGKLISDPQPAKAHRDKSGNLTRAGFDAMSPAAKAAHCKSGAGIID